MPSAVAKARKAKRRGEPGDELYWLPLDEFTAARNALAKELRQEGDADGAERVKALRKPDRVGWAINRAVRSEPKALKGVLDATEGLREAQEAIYSGKGDRTRLRKAIAAERSAVDKLTAAAVDADGGEGVLAADAIATTIRAAIDDEEVAEQLRAGRVLRRRGGSGSGVTSAPSGRGRGATADAKAGKAAEPEEPKPDKAAIRKAESAVRRAEKRADSADTAVEKARGKLDRAREAVEAADEALRAAEAAASGARTEADEARAEREELG